MFTILTTLMVHIEQLVVCVCVSSALTLIYDMQVYLHTVCKTTCHYVQCTIPEIFGSKHSEQKCKPCKQHASRQ